MSSPKFVHVSFIRTTPEKLWQALTSPEFTQQYWGRRSIQSEWEVGSSVKHIREDGGFDWQGEVLEADPPKRLSYTWDVVPQEGQEKEPVSRVTFELMPMGDVVRLQLVHDELESQEAADELVNSGWSPILSSLKSLLETGEALHFKGWS